MDDQFTRCPQCRTTFRVTTPQLALREGQVRCGRCRTVFNAYGSMVNFKGDRVPGPGMEGVQHETMTLRDFVLAKEGEFTIAAKPITVILPSAPITVAMPETQITHIDFQDAGDVPTAKDADKPSVKTEAPQAQPAKEDIPTEMLTTADAEVDEDATRARARERHQRRRSRKKHRKSPLALVLDTKKPTIWKKLGLPNWCRPLFYALALPGLALLLAGQATYFFHDTLASYYPKWTPTLKQGCQWLGCEIRALPDRDALTIEASDLQSDPNQAQRLLLSATLRNRSARPVAYPTLQLELTDTQGKLQSRRYFTPDEYLVNSNNADTGLAASSDVALRLLLQTSLEKASGYRLSLDYSTP